MQHKEWSINGEKGAGGKQSYKRKFRCQRIRVLAVMPVNASYSVGVDLYAWYYFLSLLGSRMNSASWRSYPETWLWTSLQFWNSLLSLAGWPLHWHTGVRSGVLGFSAICEGARELVLVLGHRQVSSSVSWDGRVSQVNLRKPERPGWRCSRKKAVSAECFNSDKLLNVVLLFSLLPDSRAYLHMHLCIGRGRSKCFLMFQM